MGVYQTDGSGNLVIGPAAGRFDGVLARREYRVRVAGRPAAQALVNGVTHTPGDDGAVRVMASPHEDLPCEFVCSR